MLTPAGYQACAETEIMNWGVAAAQRGSGDSETLFTREFAVRSGGFNQLSRGPRMEATRELSTLLQAIGSTVQLMEARLDPLTGAHLRPVVERTSAALQRATALVRELHELSASTTASHEATDLGTAVMVIANLIRGAAGPTIRVEFDIQDDVPVVICNRRELKEAMLNLVTNAGDAMPSGGLLKLSVYREAAAPQDQSDPVERQSNAVLRVSDTGCGTSAMIGPLVFRPYFTTMRPGKGNGAGLDMVSKFAREVGGSVEIQTSVGQGTSVILRLPGQDPASQPTYVRPLPQQ